jgi:hypothetical protein
MSIRNEVASGLYGAWRLARGDVGGIGYINATRDGFWHSFLAMAIVAPLFALLLLLRSYDDGSAVAPARFFSVQAIAYVIGWFVFPLAMFYVVPMIDRTRRYFVYIAAYNWASVLQNCVYIPLAIVAELGLIPLDLAHFLGFIVLTMVFVYSWFIARAALGVNGFVAALIAGLDFLLSVVLNAITESMLRGG